MDIWLRIMMIRLRYWWDFTVIKLAIASLRLKLSLMQIELGILIVAKKLLTKLNGEEL